MKMQRIIPVMLVFVSVLLLTLVGCDKGSKSVQPTNQQKKAAAGQKLETPAEIVPTPPPIKFVYDVEGRKDPFQPMLLVKRAVDAEGTNVTQTPLQQYEVVQIKLVAVILGYGEPMAMVMTPDGKSHYVRKGYKMGKNGGKVVRITTDSVLVEEKFRDVTDAIVTNMVELKIPKREGV